MKHLLFFILLSSTAKSQTYTTSQLSTYLRGQLKTNDSLRNQNALLKARLDQKDNRDDERNVKIKRLEVRVDSAAAYFNSDDFDFDSASKIYSIKKRIDTFVIIRKVQRDFAMIPDLTGLYLGNRVSQKDQDTEYLKWQIGKLQKIIDKQQVQINKLTKKKN